MAINDHSEVSLFDPLHFLKDCLKPHYLNCFLTVEGPFIAYTPSLPNIAFNMTLNKMFESLGTTKLNTSSKPLKEPARTIFNHYDHSESKKKK